MREPHSYDNEMVIGFQYEDKKYYFEKNAQGDILRIYDEAGMVVSEYIYDAWGKVVDIVGDEELAKINPFRYRGYYQDNETGFYYLQSRYYDGVTGRFLNADSKFTDKNNILGSNLFVYCYNNSINMIDYDGREALSFTVIYFAACALIIICAVAFVISPTFQRAWNNVCDSLIDAVKESFDMMYGIITAEAVRLSTKAKIIYDSVCSSIAKVGSLLYNHSTEVHHIVAKKASNAKYARKILDNVDIGYDSNYNLVRIKTGLHRRLHTNVYYGWANSVIIKAYNSAGNNYARQRSNVLTALSTLKAYIQAMNTMIYY